MTLNQLAVYTRVLEAYYVDYLFSLSGNSRVKFISAAVPSLVLLVAFIFLRQNPRWLAS